MTSGWVPVTPRGRVLWSAAQDKRKNAQNMAVWYFYDEVWTKQHGHTEFPTWEALRKLGWTVQRCAVGKDSA